MDRDGLPAAVRQARRRLQAKLGGELLGACFQLAAVQTTCSVTVTSGLEELWLGIGRRACPDVAWITRTHVLWDRVTGLGTVRSMQCNRAFFSRPRKTQDPGDSAWSGLGGEKAMCIFEGTGCGGLLLLRHPLAPPMSWARRACLNATQSFVLDRPDVQQMKPRLTMSRRAAADRPGSSPEDCLQ
jgi:hypothetical protein